jgi:hypothetical protein
MMRFIGIICAFVFFSNRVDAQFFISRTYGAPGTFNEGAGIVKTSDGGYLIAGSTGGWGSVNGDVLLIRTDTLGNQIWAKIYGGVYTEKAVELIALQDGNFLVGALTNESENGDYSIWLLKVDINGNVLRSQFVGTDSWDIIKGLAEGADGSIVVSALSYAQPFPNGGHLLVKLDSLGNELWRRTVSDLDGQLAGRVVFDLDGNVITVGATYDTLYLNHAMALSKFSSSGEFIWQQLYNTSNEDFFTDVCLGPDSSILVCGSTIYNDSSIQGRIFKFDKNGSELLGNVTETNNRLLFSKISYWPGDSSLIIGTIYDEFGSDQALLMKYGADFLFKCSAIGPGIFESAVGDVGTTDNSFLFCGTSSDYTPGLFSIFFMKLDPFTCLGSYDFQLDNEKIDKRTIEIYPNPNSGTFTLTGIENVAQFFVYDALGRHRNCRFEKTGNSIQVNADGLETGIYVFRILSETGKEIVTKRFTIVR